jgi:hypothetical protein
VTSTTIAQGEQAAADGHADDESESRKDKDDEDSSPIGIAFAGVSTLLLAAISGKLLSSKS